MAKTKKKSKSSIQSSIKKSSIQHKIGIPYINKLKNIVKRAHPASLIFIVLIALYFSLTLSCLYQRYIWLEMKEPTDSAAFMQMSWEFLGGTPFTVTTLEHVVADYPHNFLGRQLMFTLLLFTPIFIFTSSGVPFLVLQALIITLAAIPLYLLAGRLLKNNWFALLICACYLFNPITFETFEQFGFRLETLFIPAFFAMFYFIEKDKYVPAWISLVIALLTKHNMIAFCFMLGLYYLIFDRKHRKFAIFCLCLSIGYYIIGVKVIIAKYQVSDTTAFKHFAKFGATPKEVVINLLKNPAAVFELISPLEWKYVRYIFVPAGLFALFHPVFWISLPQLAMNAILEDYHSVYCAWHWAAVTPFLFIGIVFTISWIFKKFKTSGYIRYIKYAIAAILVIDLLYNFTDYNKKVLAADKNYYYKNKNIDTIQIINQLAVIPPDASVMASGQLLWFLSAREKIYIARTEFHTDVDYVAILLPMGQAGYQNIDKYFIQELPKANSMYKKDFKVISKSPNLLILKNRKL